MENAILEFFGGDTLTLAGLFLILFGYLFGRRTKPSVALPVRIKDYEFVEEIAYEHPQAKFRLGLYRNPAGAEAYVKQWSGLRRDDAYYALKNETLAYRYFQEIFARHAQRIGSRYPNFQIPELISVEEGRHSLTLCIRKVPGQPLEALTDQETITSVMSSISYLEYIDAIGQEESLKSVPPLSVLGLTFLLPLLMVKAVLKKPSLLLASCKAAAVFLISLPTLVRHKGRSLVHRDLTTSNILVDGTQVAIIDFEAAIRAPLVLELAQVVVGFLDRPGFISEFYATERMRGILSDPDSFSAYRGISLYVAFLHLATEQLFSPSLYRGYLRHLLELKPLS